MKQVYWLDPVKPRELLEAILEALTGGAHLAIEGEADPITKLARLVFGGSLGLRQPFSREYKPDSTMLVVPVERGPQVRTIAAVLLPDGKLMAGVEAIQIERAGVVEFLAGDGFHRQCVSVGSGVPESLLSELRRKGIIRGFYTSAEARKHFGLDDAS